MVKPKKYLGQHFLTDLNIADKIAAAIPDNANHLLEIGPGKGVITERIMHKGIPDFKAIEIDQEAVEFLKQHYIDLHLIHGDFLNYPIDSLFDMPFHIFGNFPYNISSQILFRALEFRNQIQSVTGMFQKEVADRIASPPNKKSYGILSVLIQTFYEVEVLFKVGRGAFFPSPKVDSSVIKLIRNSRKTTDCNEALFFQLVKKGFNQRRKTLRNSLKPYTFEAHSKVNDLLALRAENLTPDDFIYLTTQLR